MIRKFVMGLVALTFLTPTALAGGDPDPTAVDRDGDGVLAASMDVNSDSKVDHLDIRVRKADYDCDDEHATSSPKLTEIVGDGIDNDCNGTKEVFPFAISGESDGSEDPQVLRFLKNSGTKDVLTFIDEYARCKAAPQCRIDKVAGTMQIMKAYLETHVFSDVYCGTSKTLGADGIREVVTLEGASHYRGTTCSTGKVGARGVASSGGGTGSGVDKTYVDGSVKVLREEAAKELEARLAEEALEDAEDDVRDAEINALNGSVFELQTVDETLTQAIQAESQRAQAAENVLNGLVANALSTADSAQTTADSAEKGTNEVKSHSGLVETRVVTGELFRRALQEVDQDGDMGSTVREAAMGSVGFEARTGVDAHNVQLAVFGQVSFGSDGQGTGPDNLVLIGSDLLFDAGQAELGPWAAWYRSDDHANLLDVSVVENGGLLGFALQGDLTGEGRARAVPFLRLGGGRGFYGTKGTDESGVVVTSDYGWSGLVQVGFGGGIGALRN